MEIKIVDSIDNTLTVAVPALNRNNTPFTYTDFIQMPDVLNAFGLEDDPDSLLGSIGSLTRNGSEIVSRTRILQTQCNDGDVIEFADITLQEPEQQQQTEATEENTANKEDTRPAKGQAGIVTISTNGGVSIPFTVNITNGETTLYDAVVNRYVTDRAGCDLDDLAIQTFNVNGDTISPANYKTHVMWDRDSIVVSPKIAFKDANK